MHTVRNRIASRPPVNTYALPDTRLPNQHVSRQELNRMLRTGASSATLPESPALLSSMASGRMTKVGAEVSDTRPQKRRNAKGKKARKAAARKAAAAAAASSRTAKEREVKRRDTEMPPQITPSAPADAYPMPAMGLGEMLDQCLQAEPALALMLPSRPEPLVELPAPAALFEAEVELLTEAATEPAATPAAEAEADAKVGPESVTPSVLVMAGMPELLVEMPEAEAAEVSTPALLLPAVPEPLVDMPAEPAVAPPATALASLADAQSVPLPRSRAIVPARRQGLVDVIAFLLRDSGRRLARWSARRHKTRAEQADLRRAEARQINLQRELEALDVLRRNRA